MMMRAGLFRKQLIISLHLLQKDAMYAQPNVQARCGANLQMAACTTLRFEPGKDPRENRVSPQGLFLRTPDYVSWESTYYGIHQKAELVPPEGEALGFLSAGTRTGLTWQAFR